MGKNVWLKQREEKTALRKLHRWAVMLCMREGSWWATIQTVCLHHFNSTTINALKTRSQDKHFQGFFLRLKCGKLQLWADQMLCLKDTNQTGSRFHNRGMRPYITALPTGNTYFDWDHLWKEDSCHIQFCTVSKDKEGHMTILEAVRLSKALRSLQLCEARVGLAVLLM